MIILIIAGVVCLLILLTSPAAKQTEAQMRTPSGFTTLILLLAALALIMVLGMGLGGFAH